MNADDADEELYQRSSAFIRVPFTAMTLDELKQRLYDAGCSPNNYHMGRPEGASDVYCLAKRDAVSISSTPSAD